MTESENRRCAVVTGSTRGIGRAVARELAAAGMNVVVHLELARKVMASDDKIDAYFDEIRDKMIAYIKAEHGEQGNRIFDLIMVTKYLERIGDHATNIAEWVEFSITGVHKDSAALHES